MRTCSILMVCQRDVGADPRLSVTRRMTREDAAQKIRRDIGSAQGAPSRLVTFSSQAALVELAQRFDGVVVTATDLDPCGAAARLAPAPHGANIAWLLLTAAEIRTGARAFFRNDLRLRAADPSSKDQASSTCRARFGRLPCRAGSRPVMTSLLSCVARSVCFRPRLLV